MRADTRVATKRGSDQSGGGGACNNSAIIGFSSFLLCFEYVAKHEQPGELFLLHVRSGKNITPRTHCVQALPVSLLVGLLDTNNCMEPK